MTYELYVTKNKPISLWTMDSLTPPYPDYSGMGAVANKKSGSANAAIGASLVAGGANCAIFYSTSIGEFACPLFQQGSEREAFALEAWIYPVLISEVAGLSQVLSHDTFYDGITVNGTVITFSTQYLTAGTASCSYDMTTLRACHVVAQHNANANDLWVNGEHVATIALTDAQKEDKYIATTPFLYAGNSATNARVAMNGVAFYRSLTDSQIKENFRAGNRVVDNQRTSGRYGGQYIEISREAANIFQQRTWNKVSDFAQGGNSNVSVGSQLRPSEDSTGLSQAGSWYGSMALTTSATSVYGLVLEWVGTGVVVEYSVNNTTWSTATNGSLLTGAFISPLDPTNKDLMIRVTFAGGVLNDKSFLSSITATGFLDNTLTNQHSRVISYTTNSVVRMDREPTEFADDNGMKMASTLAVFTIGADTNGLVTTARTFEVWIKARTGTIPTFNISGTQYRNGAVDSTIPNGQWSLVHIVAAADITSAITITGSCLIGQVVIYPTALSATQVADIYASYTGYPVIQIVDTPTFTISEPAIPASIYTHQWSINDVG